MVTIADAPEIILLNEQQIENLYSYINEGTIKEIVESSREASSTDAGVGIKKLIELQFGTGSEDENSEETVRNVDTFGKFAVLHTNLDDGNDITRIEGLDKETRSNLEDGQYIETKGTITRSPISDLQDVVDEVVPMVQMLGMTEEIESDEDDMSLTQIQEFVNNVNSREDLYLQGISSSDLSANVLFSLEGLVSEVGQDFPTKYTEYRVLSSIEHVYKDGETESLMELADMMPDGRNKMQRMQFMNAMAEAADEITDRDVGRSDLEIGHPDIRVRPMAIYLT